MSSIQKFFVWLLPRRWAEGMEAESRRWMVRCTCGFERSFWDLGGIRWKAAGNERRYLRCPQCRQRHWHTVFKSPSPELNTHKGR